MRLPRCGRLTASGKRRGQRLMERAPRFESEQTRDAVAQVLDYSSFLETLTNDDLITLITSQSGGEGIEDFRDGEAFEE